MPAQFRLVIDNVADTGERIPGVEVINGRDSSMEQVSVAWCYEHDFPFETSSRRLGGWVEFTCGENGPLDPGVGRLFTFPVSKMAKLLSIVQSLSSEKYFVSVTCDGETHRIDGRTFGGWIEKEFG